MKSLKDVTLVAVSSLYLENTILSLLRCSGYFKFYDIKLITDETKNLHIDIKQEHCRRLTSKEAYSHYLIYDLHKHIESDYCLIIQHDGFIINPELWDDEYLNYDYIGAPWPVDDMFKCPEGNQIRVGNGGFSLRSKRILGTSIKEHLSFVETGYDNHHYETAEDINYCVYNRKIHEKYGNRFSPLELALKFSKEDNSSRDTFGIHCLTKWRKTDNRESYTDFTTFEEWKKLQNRPT